MLRRSLKVAARRYLSRYRDSILLLTFVRVSSASFLQFLLIFSVEYRSDGLSELRDLSWSSHPCAVPSRTGLGANSSQISRVRYLFVFLTSRKIDVRLLTLPVL